MYSYMTINQVFFLDVFMFIFFLQFIFYFNKSFLSVFVSIFLKGLVGVFSFTKELPLSGVFSFFIFVFLLTCCFVGYFCYSFSPCGMLEFTFVFAFVSWMSTLLVFISSEKFAVYMSKGGDSYLKTLVFFAIEFVSEFSRPFALTVRLTVNIMVGHIISMSLYQMLEISTGDLYIFLMLFAILMECFVFFIQSYVFSRLVYLYLNE